MSVVLNSPLSHPDAIHHTEWLKFMDEFQGSLRHGGRIELGHVPHLLNLKSIWINAMLGAGFCAYYFCPPKNSE